MVTVTDKATTDAPMLTSRQPLSHSCATRAALLRGECCRNFPHSSASLCRFAFKYRKESSPTSIRDAFGQVMIFHHAANVQLFHRDVIKLADELQTCLVREVQPLPFDFQVLFCQQARRLPPIVTAALLPTHVALRRLQSSFGVAQMVRVRDGRARRERGEVLQADIYADTCARLWQVAALITCNAKRDVPAVNFSLNGDGLNRPFYGTGEAHATTPYLGERQLVAHNLPPRLRKSERIIAVFVPEARIAGLLSSFDSAEETVEGLLHALESVLQDLAVHGGQIQTLLFDVGQLVGLALVVERDARLSVGVSPLLQSGVVQLAADVQRSGQLLLNRARDSQLVLEGFAHCLRGVWLFVAQTRCALHHKVAWRCKLRRRLDCAAWRGGRFHPCLNKRGFPAPNL